jgi:hypothetical protein
MELHRDQGRNFESRLMQEVLERLGSAKTIKNTTTAAVRWNGGRIREDSASWNKEVNNSQTLKV